MAIANVDPTHGFAGPSGGTEGSAYTLAGFTATDPGADTITSWIVEWGDDQSTTLYAKPDTLSHTYADNGTYVIRVGVVDDDGTHVSPTAKTVQIANVAPALTTTGSATTPEGAAYVLGLVSADPGTDTIDHWTIDWGDNVTDVVDGNPSSASHVYNDADPTVKYTIHASASDEDGTYDAAPRDVTVTDVLPAPQVTGPASVYEGSPYTLSLADNDPGTGDTTGWTINWGDGKFDVIIGNASSATHAYADNGIYSVLATVHQVGGDYDSDVFALNVMNRAPQVSVTGLPRLDPARPFTLQLGPVVDPGTDTVQEFRINWGDGTAADTGSAPVTQAGSPGLLTLGSFDGSHIYADNGIYTVTITVTDDDGGSDTRTLPVTVSNVNPTIDTFVGPAPAANP